MSYWLELVLHTQYRRLSIHWHRRYDEFDTAGCGGLPANGKSELLGELVSLTLRKPFQSGANTPSRAQTLPVGPICAHPWGFQHQSITGSKTSSLRSNIQKHPDSDTANAKTPQK